MRKSFSEWRDEELGIGGVIGLGSGIGGVIMVYD
jgi:hypothetical protein